MNAPWIVPQVEAMVVTDLVSSPVDLEGEDGRDALGWASRVVATASLFLLLFNAGAIRSWASELAPGPATDPLIAAADRWQEVTQGIGFDVPVETMRGRWQAAQAARLPAGRNQR